MSAEPKTPSQPAPAQSPAVAGIKSGSDLPSRAANLSFTSAERELLRLVKTAEETSVDPADADTSLIAAAAARAPDHQRLPGLNTSRASPHPGTSVAGPLLTPRVGDVMPQDRIFDLFLRTSPQFVHLCEEKAKGWNNQRLDISFQRMAQNKVALSADPFQSQMVLKMSRLIQELDDWKNRRIATKNVNLFLDIGAAPGGFARYILEHRPTARGIGITLASQAGGMNSDALAQLPRYSIHLHDVTSLRCKFLGIDDGYVFLPHEIVECAGSFDLVMCDAHYTPPSAPATPLSQEDILLNMKILLVRELLLMYKVLKAGGNAIVKLSMKEQVFYSCLVAQLTTMFNTVDLVKPRSAYQLRSTFFALCTGYKDVPSEVELLQDLLRRLRERTPGAFGGLSTLYEPADLIARFGDLLKKKYEPIWRMQATNLARTTADPQTPASPRGGAAESAAAPAPPKSVDDVRLSSSQSRGGQAPAAAARADDDDFIVVGRKGARRAPAPHSSEASPLASPKAQQ